MSNCSKGSEASNAQRQRLRERSDIDKHSREKLESSVLLYHPALELLQLPAQIHDISYQRLHAPKSLFDCLTLSKALPVAPFPHTKDS